MARRVKTLFPATLPFDQPPPRFKQVEARGQTPFYILAWRVHNNKLDIIDNQWPSVDKHYQKCWYHTIKRHALRRSPTEPYVMNNILSDGDQRQMYFVTHTNMRPLDIAPDCLQVRMAREVLEEFYLPYVDDPDDVLGDPVWYRVGPFKDATPKET
ncbi:hypothetical protein MIND_01081500 [Mycena indigotica]|uniref:Uncharacterized protein n=1 Tax=Mycena indigotica TaxID=2126181 RepID=A0A8H6W0Z4_9AGAR|nr:uncharacterized protein MIND_01081500 [Mycena indigotica]KAF7295419.1 hypothetical protein MIND_01081500 [Mycena indigotica]